MHTILFMRRTYLSTGSLLQPFVLEFVPVVDVPVTVDDDDAGALSVNGAETAAVVVVDDDDDGDVVTAADTAALADFEPVFIYLSNLAKICLP